MSGYVERTYLFEEYKVPGKFFDDVYTPSHDARHLRVVHVEVTNYGDDTEIVVSAECDEVIDWHMQDWKDWEKGKERE